MKKVKFELLKDYSATGLVIEGLEINNEENRIRVIEKMNEVFTDIGLFTNGLKVVDLLFIDGHNLGKEGRPDWLIVLNDTNDKIETSKLTTLLLSSWSMSLCLIKNSTTLFILRD